jgi:1,2-phenylacetyl-CoA epoxidase catalytic subunit
MLADRLPWSHGEKQRLEDVLNDVWAAVFAMFDGEPQLSGETAGAIATAAENAARSAYLTAVFGAGVTS